MFRSPRAFAVSLAGTASGGGPTDPGTILATIERLSDLHQRGVLTDDEFAAKKAELLARL